MCEEYENMILDVLSQYGARIVVDDKWLVYDENEKEYYVYYHKKYARQTQELYCGYDFFAACTKLLN